MKVELLSKVPSPWSSYYSAGGKHKACGQNVAPHLVLSAPARHLVSTRWPRQAPCLVKEKLHLYSPKITSGTLKATTRLMWPAVKTSLTPLLQVLALRRSFKCCPSSPAEYKFNFKAIQKGKTNSFSFWFCIFSITHVRLCCFFQVFYPCYECEVRG